LSDGWAGALENQPNVILVATEYYCCNMNPEDESRTSTAKRMLPRARSVDFGRLLRFSGAATNSSRQQQQQRASSSAIAAASHFSRSAAAYATAPSDEG